MSTRLSFRPRAVDINKKLPIVRSIVELDAEPNVQRSIAHGHIALDAENEEVPTHTKKAASEIPIPISHVVESYNTDYPPTFVQPPSYLRAKAARSEATDFVEYDLDDEDDDWLQQFNNERKVLAPEKFEWMLYKLELLDHKYREKMNGGPAAPGTHPILPSLPKESALEALKGPAQRVAVLTAVYDYWKDKRKRWCKPFFRRLQPPPSVNDTNPFNVFRPREKVHRPHTRRMQRRENDVQSFEKLRQVRKNLFEAKEILCAIQKREEKKREFAESETELQKLQLHLRHDARLVGDEDLCVTTSSLGAAMPSGRRGVGMSGRSSGGDMMYRGGSGSAAGQEQWNGEMGHGEFKRPRDMSSLRPAPSEFRASDADDQLRIRLKKKRRKVLPPRTQRGPVKRVAAVDELEPVLLFTKPLDEEALQATGLIPPVPTGNAVSMDTVFRCQGRFGRGGRIIFDRYAALRPRPHVEVMPPNGTSYRFHDPHSKVVG